MLLHVICIILYSIPIAKPSQAMDDWLCHCPFDFPVTIVIWWWVRAEFSSFKRRHPGRRTGLRPFANPPRNIAQVVIRVRTKDDNLLWWTARKAFNSDRNPKSIIIKPPPRSASIGLLYSRLELLSFEHSRFGFSRGWRFRLDQGWKSWLERRCF